MGAQEGRSAAMSSFLLAAAAIIVLLVALITSCHRHRSTDKVQHAADGLSSSSSSDTNSFMELQNAFRALADENVLQVTAQNQVRAPAERGMANNAAFDGRNELLRWKRNFRNFHRQTKGRNYQYRLALYKLEHDGKIKRFLYPDLPAIVEVDSDGESTKYGPGTMQKYPTIADIFYQIKSSIVNIAEFGKECSVSQEISMRYHRQYFFPLSIDIMYTLEECPEYPSLNGKYNRLRVRLSQFVLKDFECPSPKKSCDGKGRRVICGNENCQYDNICLAVASGYKRRQCSQVSKDGALPSF